MLLSNAKDLRFIVDEVLPVGAILTQEAAEILVAVRRIQARSMVQGALCLAGGYVAGRLIARKIEQARLENEKE